MLLIAELANLHDGSLGEAMALSRACIDAGVDAIKGQCHLWHHESSQGEQFRVGVEHHQDGTRQDYWRRTGFILNEWQKLAEEIRFYGQRHVKFGVSVFCPEAVDMMHGLVDFWKVPSGEANSPWVDEILRDTVIPIYWSLGLFDTYPNWCNVIPMKCVTAYPSQAEQIEIDPLYGLSDHSGSIVPGICAAYVGCPVLEVHVCWDRRQFAPDARASITVDELKELVVARNMIRRFGVKPVSVSHKREVYERYRVGRPYHAVDVDV